MFYAIYDHASSTSLLRKADTREHCQRPAAAARCPGSLRRGRGRESKSPCFPASVPSCSTATSPGSKAVQGCGSAAHCQQEPNQRWQGKQWACSTYVVVCMRSTGSRRSRHTLTSSLPLPYPASCPVALWATSTVPSSLVPH